MSDQEQYFVACAGGSLDNAAESLKKSFDVERCAQVNVEVRQSGNDTFLAVCMPKGSVAPRAFESVLIRACGYMTQKGEGRVRFMVAASSEAEQLKASGAQPSVTAAIPKVAKFSAS